MDKKDIYEHLANIYLDASSKKKKKSKDSTLIRNSFFVSIGIIFLLGISLLFNMYSNKRQPSSSVMLVLSSDAAKINFHFDPAKKEIYAINLNKLNLAPYKTLSFTIRKTDYNDKISLRVEFVNVYGEASFVYLPDISNKWQEHKIAFSDFKHISDWSEMTKLCFVVEEWNVRQKKDVVYIDNVKVVR